GGTVLQQPLKPLTCCAQFPIQRPSRIVADHQLCQAERRHQHPENERRQGDEDLAAQAGTTPAHGSPRIPCIAGRGRAGASGRLKVTSVRSRSTRTDWAVASGFSLLSSCHATIVYSPADRFSSTNRPCASVTAKCGDGSTRMIPDIQSWMLQAILTTPTLSKTTSGASSPL